MHNTRRWRLVAAAILLLAAGWSGWIVTNRLRAQSWHVAAESALAAGRYPEAERCLKRSLELGGAHPETYRLLARSARCQAKYDEAAQHLRRSMQLDGDAEMIALEDRLAEAQQGNLHFESLLMSYVVAEHPETDAILEAVAAGQLAAFRIGQARTSAERLLERRVDYIPALMLLGKATYHARNYHDAAKAYQRASEMDPEHDEARAALAECLLLLNQPAEALRHYQALLPRRPDDADVRVGLARCLLGLGRLDEVRPHAEAALAGGRRAQAMQVLGKLELDLENPAAAERWLGQALELAPFERDGVHSYILCLSQLGRDTEARTWQKRLQTIDLQRARLRELVKDINTRPDDPSPRLEAGKVFLSIGNEREGVRWLESALCVDPGHAPTHAVLAEHYRRQGDAARAARHEAPVRP